jgi:hypothetical protein
MVLPLVPHRVRVHHSTVACAVASGNLALQEAAKPLACWTVPRLRSVE